MKAQSLSVSTIVIIVIAVVVLAAVLLFFFAGFGKPQSTVNDQNFVAYCQTVVEHIQNSNPSSPNEINGTSGLAANFGFCTNKSQYGNKNCGSVMHPVIHTLQGGDCRLYCDTSGTPQCE